VIVNNTITVPESSVADAPSNKAVALIDSGASYSYVFSVPFFVTELTHSLTRYVSKKVSDALYSNIPGAVFDSSSGYWILPCDAEVDMALQIGSVFFEIS
jgi:saccharopepsin